MLTLRHKFVCWFLESQKDALGIFKLRSFNHHQESHQKDLINQFIYKLHLSLSFTHSPEKTPVT